MLKSLPPRTAPGLGPTAFMARFAFVAMVEAVLARRFELIDTTTMLTVLALVLLLVVAALVGVAGAMTHIWRKGSLGFGRAFGALALVVLTLAPFAGAAAASLLYPPIDEVSTDLDDPPPFRARPPRPAPVFDDRAPPSDYARLQREAYPDIVTRRLPLSTVEAHAAAHLAAQELGWTIRVEQEPPSEAVGGSFEAGARSLALAIPSDFSVRILPDGEGSAVDVRSASRYPMRDFGENARRVRAFFARMDEIMNRPAS